jgi:hypothetical protein
MSFGVVQVIQNAMGLEMFDIWSSFRSNEISK